MNEEGVTMQPGGLESAERQEAPGRSERGRGQRGTPGKVRLSWASFNPNPEAHVPISEMDPLWTLRAVRASPSH